MGGEAEATSHEDENLNSVNLRQEAADETANTELSNTTGPLTNIYSWKDSKTVDKSSGGSALRE
ncbi:hypothetical protein F441_21994 [Phytophthora nicotianae CJ01A1]|uniref:Uncharacterized protein n=5 Tax=Phytophthora nicotianae TaxID=4792 RepID=W2PHD5_PHYN3|nr:hypothetical protein PPTG_24423 [Phytophthora nicotianae INRA-310]ETI30811.1 hypothetical protein F443_22100 [Phytophthora nicotianae P1569]ETK71193.1 hypothetical protein L915_21502 [Phytophthora nicotianae]ETO59523.1 hypothetical protein F444_22116 [Phytophthora nicotianae P1976]ETP00598.1 hypothetical protein F441_21994 [Phytophthora nicotianae CJ01A1]ETL24641.1 hypothetical protein L916_21366 [Phytophthora nicotianae]